MATTIITKNGSGAPDAADLEQGELAVDLTNKRLYTEDSGGSVIEVGINPTEITTGDITATGTTTITTADINGGTIDDTTIGGTTPAAGSFTTITGSGDMNIDSGTLFVDASADSVGIGTSSPSTALHISGTSEVLRIEDTDATLADDQSIGKVEFYSNDASGAGVGIKASVEAIAEDSIGRTSLVFSTADATTNDNEAMRIDSSGNVGIAGDATIGAGLGYAGNISSAGNGHINFYDTATGAMVIDGFTAGYLANSGIHFKLAGSEKMRIDSSGNLLVGKSAIDAGATAGVELQSTGLTYISRSTTPLVVNRIASDGDVVVFRKDGSTVGSIGSVSGNSTFYGTQSNTGYITTNGSTIQYTWNIYDFSPYNDNARDLGKVSKRWNDAYVVNGVTTGSDRNDKQDIEELSEAEQRVAVACKSLLRKWRWKDAVAEKGDDARIHFGIIAQDLQAAFEAEGLDAGRYGMFMYNEWWETYTDVPAVEAVDAVYETVTDEEGNETQVLVSEAVEAKEAYTRTDTYETEAEAPEGAVKKERMGVRYSELLAFIIAAI